MDNPNSSSNKIIKLMGLSLSQLPSSNFVQSGNKFTTLIIIFGIHRRISKPLLVLPVYYRFNCYLVSGL